LGCSASENYIYIYICRSVRCDAETLWEIYTWEILKQISQYSVGQHTLEGSPKHMCEDNIQKDIQETGRGRGLTRLRTGPSGGPSRKWYQAFGLHKMWGISSVAEDLLPSHKGLSLSVG
jgi:hypothetical protein